VLTRPRVLLHVEGAAVFLVVLLLYWRIDGNWLLFVVLLLAPDISMLGYMRNTRVGAAIYNLFHSYVVPLLVGSVGLVLGDTLTQALVLIWLAHIGMDRALGFGLKYPDAFKHTHLDQL
jgi:hypothetical protein